MQGAPGHLCKETDSEAVQGENKRERGPARVEERNRE